MAYNVLTQEDARNKFISIFKEKVIPVRKGADQLLAWIDCDGEFIEETESCVEVTHKPDDDDIWQCTKCGWEGPGKNALSNKTYRVSFNVAGSIVMTASSSDMAEKMVMEGIRGEDSSMMQDIAAILQNHLAHADVSIDEVEEKDDDE